MKCLKLLPVVFVCINLYSQPVFKADIPLLKNYADSLHENKKFQEAASSYISIYDLVKKGSLEKGEFAFLTGRSYKAAGDRQKAVEWYTNASEVFSALKAKENYYKTLSELATLDDDDGYYSAAINKEEEVVEYFIQQKDSPVVTRSLLNLGLYNLHAGNVQQSVELYYRAIDFAAGHSDNLKAMAYNQLGNIWADELKDESKALEWYIKSLDLKLKFATPQSISASYNNIGLSYKNLGQLDSAMYFYNIALNYANLSKLPQTKVNPLINIGNLLKRDKKHQQAISYYRQVLDLKEVVTIRQQGYAHTNMGIAYKELGEYKKSLEHLSVAGKLAEELNDLTDWSDVLLEQALVYEGMNNYQQAYQAYIQYATLRDSMYARRANQQLADMLVKYEAAEKDLKILEQQQSIHEQNLRMQKRSLLALIIITVVLAVAGVLFYLFKRKQADAKRVALELELAEQKEIASIQDERLRISRELHDNIGSYLTLMSASVEQVAENNDSSSDIAEFKDTLTMSMRELRKTVWLLNKQAISIDEIAVKLRDFFKPLQKKGIAIVVSTTGETDVKLTEVQTTHLFRIIQEAVNNSYKHSECSEIKIQLNAKEMNRFYFSIKDNGKGMEEMVSEGNGLKNLQFRIEELGGSLQVTSSPGKGTKVYGSFYFEKENIAV